MKHRSLLRWCALGLPGLTGAVLLLATLHRPAAVAPVDAPISDLSAIRQAHTRPRVSPPPTGPGNKPGNLVDRARQARSEARPETVAAAARNRVADQLTTGIRALAETRAPAAGAVLRGRVRGIGARARSPEQQAALERLRTQLGPGGALQVDNVDNTLRQVRGPLLSALAASPDFTEARQRGDFGGMAVATVAALSTAMATPLTETRFVARPSQPDELGMVHVRLDQQVHGFPVLGAQVVVHFNAQGEPVEMNGVYAPTPASLPQPAFTLEATEALEHARAAIRDPGTDLKEPEVRRVLFWNPTVSPVAAFAVDLVPSLTESWQVLVHAGDGRILRRQPTTYQAAAIGQSADLLGQPHQVYCWQEGTDYLAIDTTLPMYDTARSRPPSFTNIFGGICIFDVQKQDVDEALKQGVGYSRTANPNQWDPTAVSMLSHFRRIDEYYRGTHNRNSFDNKGLTLTGLIHAYFKDSQGRLYTDNAYFTPSLNVMVFGDGESPPGMLPASLDIVAHELSHGVVDNSAAFRYENQPGALHEHMADFFACMIDRDDWLMGEDGVTGEFTGWRDLQNPHNPKVKSPGPATMAEYKNLPNTPDGDLGGVHVNSTIPSHATFLCAEGPAGIGRDKTERIVYRALTQYLTQYANFVDYRRAMISAANDLFPGGSEPTAVAQAFDAVQILDGNASPPPTPVPATEGEERAAFLRAEYDPFFGDFLGYALYLLDNQDYYLVTGNAVERTRPAVSGDGTWALYVGEDGDVYWTDGDFDEALTDTGDVRTIAMSKDLRYVAFTTTDYDNQIHVLDLQDESLRSAIIRVPTSGEDVVASFADVLAFNCTSDTLYFDAFTEGILGQSEFGVWGLFYLRVKDLQCQSLLPFSPGLQIGNPAMANTRSDLLVADYVFTDNSGTTVGAAMLDLSHNELHVLASGLEVFSSPSFRGDDQKLVYTAYSDGIFYLYEAALNADRTALVQGSETPLLWSMGELVYPVGFRTGTYNPPAGQLQVNPASLTFGNVNAGGSARRSLQLANAGNADLELLAVTLEGPGVEFFDFASGLDARLTVGQQQTLDLSFSPTAAGTFNATLRLRSNAPNAPDLTVALTGVGETGPARDYWMEIWQDFQDHYSYFDYKGVNWNAVYEANRTAFQGLNPTQFGQKLNEVLQVLHDWHVYVGLPDGTYVGYEGAVARNYPNKLYPAYAGGAAYTDVNGAAVLYHNRLSGNVAHLVIDTLDTQKFSQIPDATLDQILAGYADAEGWILDFRANAGGNEANAAKFASRLVDQAVTFGHVRYRDPLSHPATFGDWIPKVLQPAASGRYARPVVGLIGQRCMSSAEWFTLMLRACPNAVLIGDQTRGASGSPVSRTVPELNLEYSISTWMAYDENRQPFEDVGIAPAIRIAPASSIDESKQRDYVLEIALSYLDWRRQLGARLPLVSARTDADRDGQLDVDEFVNATDPLSSDSGLGFAAGGLRRAAAGGLELRWTGPAGRRIHLERAPAATGPFARIAPPLSSTGGVNVTVDSSATGPGPYFYRLVMEP